MAKALQIVGLAITTISVAAMEWNYKLLLPVENRFHTVHRILLMDLCRTYRLGADMAV